MKRLFLIFATLTAGLIAFAASPTTNGFVTVTQNLRPYPAQNREDGRQRMAVLVEKFQNDSEVWNLLEAETRRRYLDEFLRCLGWDSANAHGMELYRQDTIPESRLYMVKDYRYIDYKQRVENQVFIFEAKRVKVDCDLPEHRFQTKRYTWSTMRAELGVLSNFRQFRVFDGRLKPQLDKPDEGEIIALRMEHTDYIRRFDELWDLFSKEAVRNGSLSKMLEKNDPSLVRKPLDRELLRHLDDLRLLLAGDIRKNNPHISEKELNVATQNILNRILFCRILEDRDIEPSGLLRNVVMHSLGDKFLNSNGRDTYAPSTTALYKNLISMLTKRMYNRYRVIFRYHPSDDLTISDAIIERVIMELYPADKKNSIGCAYDFRIVPIEVIGAVYERYLGNRIIVDRGQVRLEKTPSVREAGGVFYTPDNIAYFLTVQTLRELVKGKTPEQLQDLRILDPASGCGALLAQTTQYLFENARAYYAANPEKIGNLDTEFPDAIIRPDGSVKLSPYIKKRIVENCIYGVDIDDQATEIAAMWLYILILEDENNAIVDQERRYKYANRAWKINGNFKLPDLSKNLISRNSVIGPDYKGADYENARPFDWRNNDTKIASIMERGGFDAVVANPPYIGYDKLKSYIPEQLEYMKGKYRSMEKYKVDLSYAFIERMTELIKPSGKIGVIITNRLIHNQAAGKLRELLTEKKLFRGLINFDNVKVFHSATVDTCLLFLQNGGTGNYLYAKISADNALPEFLGLLDNLEHSQLPIVQDHFYIMQGNISEFSSGNWQFPNPADKVRFEAMAAHSQTLGKIAQVFQGPATGANGIFTVKIKKEKDDLAWITSKAAPDGVWIEKALLRPLVFGRSVHAFMIARTVDYVIYPYDSNFTIIAEADLQKDYPKAYEYLRGHRDFLEKRKQYKEWYGYTRASRLDELNKQKVLVALDNKAAIDPAGDFVFSGGLITGVVPHPESKISEWMILAILNSEHAKVYTHSIASSFGGRTMPHPNVIKQIPFPEYSSSTAKIYQQIEEKAKMLYKNKSLDKSSTDLQLEVEKLIERLYKRNDNQKNGNSVKNKDAA